MKKEVKITLDTMQTLKESMENNNTDMITTWTCKVDNNFSGSMFLDDLKNMYLLIKNNNNLLVIDDEKKEKKYYKLFTELLYTIKKYIKAIENREIFACIYVNVADDTITEIEKIIKILIN